MAWFIFTTLSVFAFVFGFPIAAYTIHGIDTLMWPSEVKQPGAWFNTLINSSGLESLQVYRDMALGRTTSFGAVGLAALSGIIAAPSLALFCCFLPTYGLRRDPFARHGDARWASRQERDTMRIGLELGLDLDTGRPIRVSTESHLITIAPPRTGKTSGLLIPNLLVPDPSGWYGPAIVLDPKGDAYRATAHRRRALGRQVRCLDPTSIAGGTDTWNPVASMVPTDVLYLQRVARALLPASGTDGDASYFQNRAVDAIVGAFLAAHAMKKPSARFVATLLSDPDAFQKALDPLKTVAAGAAKAILKMDPRGRDSILSTALQAFSWCADARLQKMTGKSSFALSDLCDGNTDLFITLPTEDIKTLTPLLRWLFCDLFMTVRRQRPLEPIVCFIDEAAALGRFDELVVGAGELPGYNFRLWTFWQARSQMSRIYGDDGARTLLNTADIVTYSDLGLVEPEEREFMSKAIGDYTLLDRVETLNQSTGKSGSVSHNPIPMRLITTDGVGQIPSTQLIVLPNSAHYAKRPLLIRKTRFDDPRLRSFKA